MVRPATSGDAYRLDRRFSLYLLPTETADPATLRGIKKALSATFRAISKPAVVSAGLAKIDGFISRQADIACLHARRIHLLADTELQINRFNSFLDTSYYLAAVEHLLERYEFVAAASNSRRFTTEIRRIAGEKFVALEEIVDRPDFTSLQWALLEMYFIGSCRAIYGTLSAYTAAASIIGGASLHNMFGFVVGENLAGIDKTGRIAYEQAKKQRSALDFSEGIARTSPQAALCCRLAALPDLPAGLRPSSLLVGVWRCALRNIRTSRLSAIGSISPQPSGNRNQTPRPWRWSTRSKRRWTRGACRKSGRWPIGQAPLSIC